MTALQNPVGTDLSTALGTRVRRLGVQLEIDSSKMDRRGITIQPTPDTASG